MDRDQLILLKIAKFIEMTHAEKSLSVPQTVELTIKALLEFILTSTTANEFSLGDREIIFESIQNEIISVKNQVEIRENFLISAKQKIKRIS